MKVRVAVGVQIGGLIMGVQVFMGVPMHRRRRGEPLGDARHGAGQVQDAEQDQHDRHCQLHAQPYRRRDHHLERDDRDSDHEHGHRVTEAPERPDQRAVQEALAAGENRGHRDDVIGVGGMPHAEQKAESGERDELRHG